MHCVWMDYANISCFYTANIPSIPFFVLVACYDTNHNFNIKNNKLHCNVYCISWLINFPPQRS